MKKLLLYVCIGCFVNSNAQVEAGIDTSTKGATSKKIEDYSDLLLVRTMLVGKSNSLSIHNKNTNNKIKLEPLGITSFGVGFNHKWLGLGVGFGLPPSAADVEKYGRTKRFDLQVNVYANSFVIDGFAQRYRGYHLSNPNDFVNWDKDYFPKLRSMDASTISLGGLYVFNHKRFSYKAAFVRNAVQKKSAGSILLGAYYSYNFAGVRHDSAASFIPNFFPTEVKDSFNLRSFSANSAGISFGYTYTLVLRKFFINLSLIPSIGIRRIVAINQNKQIGTDSGAAGRVITRMAFGYEHPKFILGLTGFTSTGSLDFKHYQIKPSTSNVKFFIAKRFDVSNWYSKRKSNDE